MSFLAHIGRTSTRIVLAEDRAGGRTPGRAEGWLCWEGNLSALPEGSRSATASTARSSGPGGPGHRARITLDDSATSCRGAGPAPAHPAGGPLQCTDVAVETHLLRAAGPAVREEAHA